MFPVNTCRVQQQQQWIKLFCAYVIGSGVCCLVWIELISTQACRRPIGFIWFRVAAPFFQPLVTASNMRQDEKLSLPEVLLAQESQDKRLCRERVDCFVTAKTFSEGKVSRLWNRFQVSVPNVDSHSKGDMPFHMDICCFSLRSCLCYDI